METFRDRIIDFREVRASDLAPHPLNDKIHPTEQQVALRAAARRRGITAVVYAVEREGKLLLVDGHLRRDLIQSGTVRVAVLDLTDAEVLEELVAHDQIASLAEINPTLRLANVESIPPEAVESLGLTEESIEELRVAVADETEDTRTDDFDPDAEPEGPVYSKRGEVYQLGRHRVGCLDCTEEAAWAEVCAEPIEMVLSDPPYGVTEHEWDRPLSQEDIDLMLKWSSGSVFCFGAARPDIMAGVLALEPMADRVFVWRTSGARSSNPEQAYWVWEPVYVWRQQGIRGWDAIEWSAPKDEPHELHPTQKPVELFAKFMVATGAKTIADPFLGSGTTLIAAEKLGRVCYGMEICERYVDVIRRRYAHFVEDDAYLPENSGPVMP